MSETKTRVLIAEDYQLVRQGLSFTLKEEGIDVVGEAENGEEAVGKTGELNPDVVLMDIGMPVMDGIAATQKIKHDYPNVKIIMLTSHDSVDEVLASLAAGADAYCMKDINTRRLVQVIDVIDDGALWLDPNIARLILKELPTGGNGEPERPAAPGGSKRQAYSTELTERERETLELIVQGKSNKEIAQAMNITVHTAKAHVAHIIQKLAVDDRTQVAVKALQEGLTGTKSDF